MSEQIRLRLEEVFLLIPCPISGCWGLHGATTTYSFDEEFGCHVLEVWPKLIEEVDEQEGSGHAQTGDLLFGLAEFDFTKLAKAVPLDHFHFSQLRAIFKIGWKESGQELELRIHIEPEEVDEEL